MAKWIKVDAPQAGDIAKHYSEQLDDRRVKRVSEDGKHVWLGVGADSEMGPFPTSNYTYERKA